MEENKDPKKEKIKIPFFVWLIMLYLLFSLLGSCQNTGAVHYYDYNGNDKMDDGEFGYYQDGGGSKHYDADGDGFWWDDD